jgi:predicted ATP-grasp superfamily ATP-dependent carboligase
VQQQAVLIVAQSGRFLAQIANTAGYPVWVADCFGDCDTLAASSRWRPIADITDPDDVLDTILTLSEGHPCTLVCGSGVESFSSMLSRLPDHIKLLGNSQATIEVIKNPAQFFSLLDQLAIPYPETQFEPPEITTGWLTKSPQGLGGEHIEYCKANTPPKHVYYQRHLQGISGSVLFLANGFQNLILSFNQQFLLNSPEMPFLLSGLATPLHLSDKHKRHLKKAIDSLLNHVDLSGLNSLDFILTEADELFILEVNPRPSASAELLAQRPKLFDLHIDACQGKLPKKIKRVPELPACYLHYIFAQHDIVIPDGVIWPDTCHDIPASGRLILKNDPICTAIIDTPSAFFQSRKRFDRDIHHLLS